MSRTAQHTQCAQCSVTVDAVRSQLRIEGSRIVRVCEECAAGEQLVSQVPNNISARSPSEASNRAHEQNKNQFRISRGKGLALGFSLAAAILVLSIALTQTELAVHRANAQHANITMPRKLISLYSEDIVMVEPATTPLVDGEEWVHPVSSAEELVPSRSTQLFRAMRPGDRAPECGKGHCGIDLDAPRGSPVVAVRPGIVEKAQHRRDASGGIYVWISHEDTGLRTEYFHLDRIAPGLETGDFVEAGQWLGTLGKTGIVRSAPHLHFAVRDLNRNLHYLNPIEFIKNSKIIDVLDMRMPVIETELGLSVNP